jgi:hypothetical protein
LLVRDYEGNAKENLRPTISVAKTSAVAATRLRLIQQHARRLDRRNVARWIFMVAHRRPLRCMDGMEPVPIGFSVRRRKRPPCEPSAKTALIIGFCHCQVPPRNHCFCGETPDFVRHTTCCRRRSSPKNPASSQPRFQNV